MSQSRICSVSPIYCCLSKSHKQKKKKNSSMSKASFKADNKGKSRSRYRLCVPPCPRYITSGDTHSLCVVCLGVKHAESALEGADCPHCERLLLRTLHSRRALFEEGAFTSFPRSAGPASAEASGGCISGGRSWMGMETGESLYSYSPARSTARSLRSEARSVVSSPLCFSYLPPRRWMWSALIIFPLNPHNMRSYRS